MPIWFLESSESFSVSSAYRLVRSSHACSFLFDRLWGGWFPIKWSFFMVRLLLGRLPVVDALCHFGINGPSWCECCTSPAVETLDHLFSTSDLASKLWKFFNSSLGISTNESALRVTLMRWSLYPTKFDIAARLSQVTPICTCRNLWKAGNIYFEGKKCSWEIVVGRI